MTTDAARANASGARDAACPLDGLPARIAATLANALVPLGPTPARAQRTFAFEALTGRDVVRLPPCDPTVALTRLARGVRLEAQDADGSARRVSVTRKRRGRARRPDSTGRVAQLARACPGLFALGGALRASDALDEACTRTVRGASLAAVSRVVVMDSRDSAESMGFGGMISLAMREVAYASAAGTPVVLAVETQPVAPEYVTFREEGLAVLRRELALTATAFAAEPAFSGFAIHDEEGLAALPP